jgi:hypothetical protein
MRKTYLDDSSSDEDSDEEQPIKKYKIIVIGDYKVGKSSLISRIQNNEFSILYKSTKTIEIFSNVKMGDIVVDIWDIPPHMCKYYNIESLRSDAIVLMVDTNVKDSIKNGFDIFKQIHNKLYNTSTPQLWLAYRGKRIHEIEECHPDRMFQIDSLTNEGFLDLIYDIRSNLIRSIY